MSESINIGRSSKWVSVKPNESKPLVLPKKEKFMIFNAPSGIMGLTVLPSEYNSNKDRRGRGAWRAPDKKVVKPSTPAKRVENPNHKRAEPAPAPVKVLFKAPEPVVEKPKPVTPRVIKEPLEIKIKTESKTELGKLIP